MGPELGIFAAAFTVIVTIIGAVWSLKGEFAALRAEFGDKMHRLAERLIRIEQHVFGSASFESTSIAPKKRLTTRPKKRKR